MQVMLLGFVLLGRSLEESARLKASSDMNELIVSTYLSIYGNMEHSTFCASLKIENKMFGNLMNLYKLLKNIEY
jgi:hypothetical protein